MDKKQTSIPLEEVIQDAIKEVKKSHTDPKILGKQTIRCPECKKEQIAFIEDGYAFAIYIHHCVVCKHIITESEWDPVHK